MEREQSENREKQQTRRGKRKTKDEENVTQITVDEEEEMADMVHQGNSDAVPPTTPPRSAFTVVFRPEEEEILKREVSRLHSYSIVCRIIGLRPNRGDLKDLLQVAFQLGSEKSSMCNFLDMLSII